MNTETSSRGEIILYQTADGRTNIDVKLENETVWLTQAQMAILFEKDQSVIASQTHQECNCRRRNR